jgi:hypothetical protein
MVGATGGAGCLSGMYPITASLPIVTSRRPATGVNRAFAFCPGPGGYCPRRRGSASCRARRDAGPGGMPGQAGCRARRVPPGICREYARPRRDKPDSRLSAKDFGSGRACCRMAWKYQRVRRQPPSVLRPGSRVFLTCQAMPPALPPAAPRCGMPRPGTCSMIMGTSPRYPRCSTHDHDPQPSRSPEGGAVCTLTGDISRWYPGSGTFRVPRRTLLSLLRARIRNRREPLSSPTSLHRCDQRLRYPDGGVSEV